MASLSDMPFTDPGAPGDDGQVIDLGSRAHERDAAATDYATDFTPPPHAPRAKIWQLALAIVFSAVLSASITVLVVAADKPKDIQRPSPPATMAELEDQMSARLREETGTEDLQLLHLNRGRAEDSVVLVDPGSYQVYIHCGVLRTDLSSAIGVNTELLTTVGSIELYLPCPSTVIKLDTELTFEELGALAVGLEDERPSSYTIILAIVSVD